MNIREIIINILRSIEEEHDVVIFYACESGSRAWGFESQDSDYDVRFLYYHKLDWYLSVEEKRDVIERPISDSLDINGWELRKALKLLRKSNPPLLEWLQSPIVYIEDKVITGIFKDKLSKYYSKRNCFYHYLHMAQGNFRDYLQQEKVWIKKYFYVLRPLLACRWIERFESPVPTEFVTLVSGIIDDSSLKKEIDKLLHRKKAGDELDYGPRIEIISSYIERELELLGENQQEKIEYAGYEELNLIFKSIVSNTADS